MNTFFRINISQVVLYFNCFRRTYGNTFSARNTAIGTNLAGFCTLVLIAARNMDWFCQRIYRNQTLRANLYADGAADTLFRTHHRHAIDYINRMTGAGLGTVPITKTAITTAGFPTEELAGGTAGLYPLIIHFIAGDIAISFAGHKRHFFLYVLISYAQHLADFAGG